MNSRRTIVRFATVSTTLVSLGLCAGIAVPSAAVGAPSDVRLRRVSAELARLDDATMSAHPASPASVRLREERDRLRTVVRSIQQLDRSADVLRSASPGSPAQLRAMEETTRLQAAAGPGNDPTRSRQDDSSIVRYANAQGLSGLSPASLSPIGGCRGLSAASATGCSAEDLTAI
jgi:hypothetical protein